MLGRRDIFRECKTRGLRKLRPPIISRGSPDDGVVTFPPSSRVFDNTAYRPDHTGCTRHVVDNIRLFIIALRTVYHGPPSWPPSSVFAIVLSRKDLKEREEPVVADLHFGFHRKGSVGDYPFVGFCRSPPAFHIQRPLRRKHLLNSAQRQTYRIVCSI